MALLSGMFRYAAITGRTDTIGAWCVDPAEALRDLSELHRRGFVTDDEFEALRARLNV